MQKIVIFLCLCTIEKGKEKNTKEKMGEKAKRFSWSHTPCLIPRKY